MLRNAAISLLLARLGNRDPVEWESTALSEMQLAQANLEGDATLRPWFLVTESAQSTLTVGDSRVELPSDFLDEVEDSALEVYEETSAKWSPLKKGDWDTLVAKYRDHDPAIPKRYAALGEYFRVQPVPDLAYATRMIYFARDTVPSTDIENKWLKWASDLLIAEAGVSMALYHVKDPDLVAGFQAQILAARNRLKIATEARMHSNQVYEMGED